MSDTDLDKQATPWGTILSGVAALLLILFIVGARGLIHLTIWVLVITLLFAFVCGGVALAMRFITR